MVRTAVRRRSTPARVLMALVALAVVIDAPNQPGLLAAESDTSADVTIGASAPATDGTDRYIVEVDGSLDAVVERQEDLGVDVVQEWDNAATGFAAELTPTDLARLARDPAVTDMHVDQVIEVSAVQDGAPWGLDRIDQLDPPLDGTYAYDSAGAGVTAYVVDTGIRSTHVEFQGRVGVGAFVDFGDGRGVEDCNGHGTHVSGILGGTVSGVAKAVTIVPVKVFDCSGAAFTSDVIAGLNWIIGDHLPGEPAVVNMSLGSNTAFEPLDSAVNAVIADGITVVAAAGNSSISTCSVSPARVAAAITVAAINADDTRASYSNIGSCNDLFAPGTSIVSADIASNTATTLKSGTSMAAPHVAGAVARYLQSLPNATPAQVRAAIGAATDPGVTGRAVGDPDKLLYLTPTAPVCTPAPPGIIGWWTGDGSPAAVVGPPLAGAATYTPGLVGTGFAFNGQLALTVNGFPMIRNAVTVEMWVKPTVTGMTQMLISQWIPVRGSRDDAFALTINPYGELEWLTDGPTGRWPDRARVAVKELFNGEWHHVAATWSAGTTAVYVDGTPVLERATREPRLNEVVTPFRIGRSSGRGNPFWFTGELDEPTVYGRALGAGEIAAIHDAGSFGKCT